ncbi:MAG: TonB-dependent receptor [Rubrivivax sp.]|nr:TonB-dependent receptor [Rubrivivax sp.]
MKHSHPRRAAPRAPLQATPVAAAVAALLLSTPLAHAQQAPAEGAAPQVITVTGIRSAIESAITTKKDADTIVEAITAEDLGKLPDPSVADSIARLPGIAAQRNRSSGKAQAISVRGLSPDFNGALLNGREVASSSDSRGVDFDLYPAELTNSALIYKTPHAGLVGAGIASTIDLRTIRPLGASGRQIALNYRDQRTGVDNGVENGEGKGDRMSFAYVDQFMNKTIGIALGAVKFTEEGAGQLRANTWGGWTQNLDYQGASVGVPGGFGRDIEYSDQEREAMMGVLQWRPNKNFETTLDIFQSKGRNANFKKGIEGFIGGGSDPWNYRTSPPNLVSAVVSNGIATSGTVDNFKGVIRNHNEGTDDELKSWGLNLRYKLDTWTFNGDVANSKVTKQSARYETTAGLTGNGNTAHRDGTPAVPGATGTISWTGFNGSNHGDLKFTSSTDFSDRNVVKLTDVMGWGGGPATPQAGYTAAPYVSDEVKNFRLTAKRDLSWGPVIGLEAGLVTVDRTKASTTAEGFLVINGATSPFARQTVPGSSTLNVDGINIATWDPRGSLGSVYSLRPNTYGAVINRNWGVKEEVTTGFLKADLDGELFGLSYSGNIGVQMVRTDQSSSGFVNDSGRCSGATAETCVSLSGGKRYTDWLPSLNLSTELMPDLVARLGIGKSMSRPTMRDMRASIDQPSLPNPPITPVQRIVSGGGNPEVEPFRATAYDVSVEKYFEKNKGYVSVAAFYKDIDTYILTLPQSYDFAGVLPANFVLPAGGSVGFLNRPSNGQGGSIKGIELAVNIPLSMLWKPLDGFGIAINHSDTKSSITIQPGQLGGLINTPLTIPLPGLSRKVTNTRIYYEKYGFQAAVSSRKRSDFLGQNVDYKDDVEISFVRGETVVDVQIGYTFPERSFLKGLSVLLQANNIGDELFRLYQSDRDSPTDTKRYGKTYLLGANYKF